MGLPQDPRGAGRPGSASLSAGRTGDPQDQQHRPRAAADRADGPLFLRSPADAILACDFFTLDMLNGTQAYVLAVIEHATQQIRIRGVTLHPTGEGTTQQARNLIMDLGGQAEPMKFVIRDRGSNFTAAFDTVLADAGIGTVLCNVRTPRRNAIAERWIGGCRRELLDRTLVWNQKPSAADPARVRDPPHPASASPLSARRGAAQENCSGRPAVNAGYRPWSMSAKPGPPRCLSNPNGRSCRWSRVWVASCRYGVRRLSWMPADAAAPAAGTAAAVVPATVIARAAGRGQPGPRRPRRGSRSG